MKCLSITSLVLFSSLSFADSVIPMTREFTDGPFERSERQEAEFKVYAERMAAYSFKINCMNEQRVNNLDQIEVTDIQMTTKVSIRRKYLRSFDIGPHMGLDIIPTLRPSYMHRTHVVVSGKCSLIE